MQPEAWATGITEMTGIVGAKVECQSGSDVAARGNLACATAGPSQGSFGGMSGQGHNGCEAKLFSFFEVASLLRSPSFWKPAKKKKFDSLLLADG